LLQVLDGKGLTKSGQDLKLRTNDDFKHLEQLADEVRDKLLKMNSEKVVHVSEYYEKNEDEN
jgi:signal peptidase II